MNMKKRIQCINFDLDSVLYIPADFLESALLMSVKAMMQTGLKAELQEALQKLKDIRSIDSNAKDHFDKLCLFFNKKHDPLIIAAGIEKYWDCKIGNMTTAPETLFVLSTLYPNYSLSIISNGPALKQAGKIVRLGLAHFFAKYDKTLQLKQHHFYATSKKTHVKPFSYLWLQSKKDIGYEFSSAVMVGDRYWEDIFGAKRLGMITIKINRGNHIAETVETAFDRAMQDPDMRDYFLKKHARREILSLMKPDYTIDSLQELVILLQKM
jgi:putative hydrolase of the HAD superfamily